MKFYVAPIVSAILFASCASTGSIPQKEAAPAVSPATAVSTAPASPAANSAAVAEPAKKQSRVITIKVPVEKKSLVKFADGSLDEYTLSDYDGANVLLLTQTRYSASGALLERTDFSYTDGKVTTKTVKDGDGKVTSQRLYTYNPQGLLIKEFAQDGAGKPISTFEYAYDAKGDRTSWIVKDSKGVEVAQTVYTYKDGRLQGAELRDGTGKKTGSGLYEYTADGKIRAQKYYNALDSLIRIESTYWDGDRVQREERTTAGGQVQQRIDYTYGSSGELTQKVIEDFVGKSKKIIQYEYVFRDEQKTVEE